MYRLGYGIFELIQFDRDINYQFWNKKYFSSTKYYDVLNIGRA